VTRGSAVQITIEEIIAVEEIEMLFNANKMPEF
jgi:hypothetical protein